MQANSNMANVAKTQTPKKKHSTISAADRKNIARAYHQLYYVFLLKNLLAGMTLGAASHSALQMVRSKIASMDKNNPVTQYLLRLNARHSKRITKRIMTSKYRDARATATPETAAKIKELMPKWLQFSLNTFNNMSKKYQPKTNATAKAPQTQQIMLQIQLKQLQNQRAAA